MPCEDETMSTPQQLEWGEIPTDLKLAEPFVIQLNQYEQPLVVIINQAVGVRDRGVVRDKGNITINDSASMRRILRRLVAIDDETEKSAPGDLASCIMETLGYEWF